MFTSILKSVYIHADLLHVWVNHVAIFRKVDTKDTNTTPRLAPDLSHINEVHVFFFVSFRNTDEDPGTQYRHLPLSLPSP